jgi:hypothetical protein
MQGMVRGSMLRESIDEFVEQPVAGEAHHSVELVEG